jgi:hypothetical protein
MKPFLIDGTHHTTAQRISNNRIPACIPYRTYHQAVTGMNNPKPKWQP